MERGRGDPLRGVDVLASMLERDESLVLGLSDEELAAPVAGLGFFQVPTPDECAPPSDLGTLEMVMTPACSLIMARWREPGGALVRLGAGLLVTGGSIGESSSLILVSQVMQLPNHPVPARFHPLGLPGKNHVLQALNAIAQRDGFSRRRPKCCFAKRGDQLAIPDSAFRRRTPPSPLG